MFLEGQKDIEFSFGYMRCATHTYTQSSHSRNPSDPLEISANSQIEYYFSKKPSVYAALHVVLNLLGFITPTQNQQKLYANTVSLTRWPPHTSNTR